MKHLATIQLEFLKSARKWEDLSLEEQQGYLKRHPKTKRRLTRHSEQVKPIEQIVQKPVEQPKIIETKPANSMSKKEIYTLLTDNVMSADNISYSNKKGGFVFKQGYFYTHGMDEDKLAQRMESRTKALGLTPKIIDKSNHWNAWPKNSWFEVVISFDQMKLIENKI